MAHEVKEKIETEVKAALAKAFGDVGATADPMVTEATKPEFGDYQCNAALPMTKKLSKQPGAKGQKSRDVAQKLLEALEIDSFCNPPEIAGPGFLNISLKNSFVEERLDAMAKDPERLGIRKNEPVRVIVDFSSPNIAKEMHVGHLRSTIIGESLCRTLEFLGYDVLRLNHVGDWGTQFGRLILYLKEVAPEALTQEGQMDLGDLVEFYKKATKRCDEDTKFAEMARLEVVKLQSGDADSLKAWNLLCNQSRKEFQKIYDLLDVNIEERGESFYNPYLHGIIDHLESKDLIAIDNGATVVYLDGYKNREGNPQPLLVKKSDGGFMYATTDLAAIQHRTSVEKAVRVLYVTDAGQATHFDQVFQVARRAELYPTTVNLEHVPFGLVHGEDGKKLKTRAGDTVKLKDLLDEAVAASEKDFRQRLAEEGREEDEDYIHHVSKVVGLSAVKYADLKTTRTSDYRFSYKRMLSMDGNTAPYMLYAYARIQGVFRKLGLEGAPPDSSFALISPQEAALGRALIRYTDTLAEIEQVLKPHIMCDYLFDLSQKFNQFYQSCSIIGAPTEELKISRISLASLTAQVIQSGLQLLGIQTLDRL